MSGPVRALTIAGSDSGGGAGIQADLKSFTAFGVYGMSAITAVTAQNTLGVQALQVLSTDLVEAQITSVVRDLGVDAAKTGMLGSADVAACVAACVRRLRIPNLVVDPVMIASSGDELLAQEALAVLRDEVLPLAAVVTPNLAEAAALSGRPVRSLDEMREAAASLHTRGARWVVVKGGHLPESEDAVDVAFDGTRFHELRAPRTPQRDAHGTGCTLSAAITAGLARGLQPLTALQRAKAYVSAAIASAPRLGAGRPPVNHLAGLSSLWPAPWNGDGSTSGGRER
jgi:hydroxymethylpyrimidine/phosphomethylpyrimidine kinase